MAGETRTLARARSSSVVDRVFEFIVGRPRTADIDEISKERRDQLLYETLVVGSKTPRESDLREALYQVMLLEPPAVPVWSWRRWSGWLGPSLESRAKEIAEAQLDGGPPRHLAERVAFIALRTIVGSQKSAITALKRFIIEEVAPVFTHPRAKQRNWVDFYERKLGGVVSPTESVLTRHTFDVAWAHAGSRGWPRPPHPYGFTEPESAWRQFWLAMLRYELSSGARKGAEPPAPPSMENPVGPPNRLLREGEQP